jgi:hypothetical protein
MKRYPSNVNIEVIEKIDGLINQRDLELFKSALENITNDLEMEDFHLNDVKSYFQLILNEYLGDQ